MAATCVLPTRIDTVRDASLLHRFGVEESQLADSDTDEPTDRHR